MRIEFANQERPGLDWNSRTLRIGSAADNDLTLDSPGVAERHVRLLHDARGHVLVVEPGAGRVYVNARQVREQSLLRAGDSLGIGETRLRLCLQARNGAPAPVGTASVRVVAGPHSGQVRSIGERLQLDNSPPWPLGLAQNPDASLVFVRDTDGLRLDARGLPEILLIHVNGLAVRETPLIDGDQIALGPHRFVIDACGVGAMPGTESASTGDPSVADPPPSEHRQLGWLLFTALLLALLIALLILL